MCRCPQNYDGSLDDTVRIARPPFDCMISFYSQPRPRTAELLRKFPSMALDGVPRDSGIPPRAMAVEWNGIWFWGWNSER